MTRPTFAIAMLDRQISNHGQTIKLVRRGSAEKTLRGIARGFKPEEIAGAGLVTQADRRVVLSPTDLGAYGIPKSQDDIWIAGQTGKVQPDIEPIYIDDVLVRVNLRARIA